jgi:hypothetical protein
VLEAVAIKPDVHNRILQFQSRVEIPNALTLPVNNDPNTRVLVVTSFFCHDAATEDTCWGKSVNI